MEMFGIQITKKIRTKRNFLRVACSELAVMTSGLEMDRVFCSQTAQLPVL